MTIPVRVDIDTADTVRALEAAFRRHDDVRVTALRLRLGRVLGRARSVLARSHDPAVIARWQAVADAASDGIERWRVTRYPPGT